MRTVLFAASCLCFGTVVSAPSEGKKAAPCYIKVAVPYGATLTVNGARTEQMTAERRFVTPELAPDQAFYYTFVASWTHLGKPVWKRQQVEVKAGGDVRIDLRNADDYLPNSGIATLEKSPFEGVKPNEPRKATEEAKPNVPRKSEPKADAPKKAVPKKPEIEVPYVPTPEPVVKEMLKLAGVKAGDIVYDLGCGDGRIVISAVKDFKAKKGLGIDFNPERIKDSETAAKAAGEAVKGKLEFKQGDVLKLTEKDFEGVDVVTLYLLPSVNEKLKPVLKKGLKAGARVVSHDFDMGKDWPAEKTTTVTDEDGTDHTVYLWTIGKK